MEQYQLHIALMEQDESFTPKHHLIIHLLFRADFLGNPRFYASWKSEALNKVLKGCCRQVSQATFEATVLFRTRSVLTSHAKRGAHVL